MEKILTFKVGKETFCIDIFNVIGIDQTSKVSAIPLAEKHHLGMMNLRGQIIPVIDLRILFHQTASLNEKEQCYVFIETDSKKMACLVDAVHDVVDCKLPLGESVASNSMLEKNSFVKQVMNVNENIVFLMDTELVYQSIQHGSQQNLKVS